MNHVHVVAAGTQTTVQDLGGRTGLWGVGVPPSGAFDDLAFALGNLAVGNPADAAGFEAVLRGPALRFDAPATICVTGAARAATLDGAPVAPGQPVSVGAGQVLDMGMIKGPGLRGYLAISGGVEVPPALGSRSTFLLGGFGGFDGRPLRKGDAIPLCAGAARPSVDVSGVLPVLTDDWELRVIPGPHGAPDYLTDAGAQALFTGEWRLDHRSDRTGVRLVGATPQWSRTDGGEAGLHPSNIHDSAYPVGGVMISGGTPVIVGPDGPSLGGFVVPAVVIRADRWKLGQIRPGDRVRLTPVTEQHATRAGEDRDALLSGRFAPVPPASVVPPQPAAQNGGVAWRRPTALLEVPADGDRPGLAARLAGDHHLLVEVGPALLDLVVRLRVHLLAEALAGTDGVIESVEGVRSLLLGFDPRRPGLAAGLAQQIEAAWLAVPDLRGVRLATREVTLPISFDDPAAHEAMRRYETGVRPDAPWCPDNVEFIRRINGLGSREEVFDIVRAATYLVVGLGDVYLGAPVAVPLDPAHRLVTTKYDPPRTWTPENAVGIGGAYLCVYGMEGPGGYQLVGRTVPVWRHPAPAGQTPWLLRMFDRLRFTPVSAEELLQLRAEVARGERDLACVPSTLDLQDLLPDAAQAGGFTARRQEAFAQERERWSLAAR